ncbi:MAG: hypothetical protein EOO05_08180 [Chitinophagaceae bacterium]|nr:MAG: hypothetical protein EOO05_08180 [Chitinophagaceae bacterium]
MIGIFKQKNPLNLLVLLVVGVLIKLPMFSEPHPPAMRPGDGVLYDAILQFLNPVAQSFRSIYPLLAFILLFTQAVWLNSFVNNQRMMTRSSYLPGMAYLLVTSLLPEWNHFSPPLLVNTILLLVLSWLFSTYNKANAKGTIFNIGVALGVAGFLFISSLTFTVWVLLALAVMRPFRITEWLICLLGITTPFYFYAIYIVIDGHWSWQEFMPHISLGVPSLKQSAWLAGSVFLIMVPFLVGGYYVQENLRRMLINVRKGWSLLLLYLLAALLLPFVNTTDTFENWLMAMIPMAAFHACTYFYSTWRPFAAILFWLTVAYILSYQYVGPGW